VVEGLVASARSLDEDAQVVFDLVLADVLSQVPRAEAQLDRTVVRLLLGSQNAIGV
jgi:hypothetical protein